MSNKLKKIIEEVKTELGLQQNIDDIRKMNGTTYSKTDSEYFDEVDPDTGLKYDIPGLSYLDFDYFSEYVRYMKMKEKNPDQFKQIMDWK